MKFFYLILFTSILPALAATPENWNAFSTNCLGEIEKNWPIEQGKSWSKKSDANLSDLKDFSTNTCPRYLKTPNDPDAIARFNAAKKKILDEAPVVESNGKILLSFLKTESESLDGIFGAIGMEFSEFSCGRQLSSTANAVSDKLHKIKQQITEMETKCFQLASANQKAPLTDGISTPLKFKERAPRPKSSGISGEVETSKKP